MSRASLLVPRQPRGPKPATATLTPDAANPVTTQLGSTLTSFGDVVYDSGTGKFHLFATVDGTSAGIYEITGDSWDSLDMATASRVLSPGTQTWEDSSVGVPTVWKEGTTWNLLYRGIGTVTTLPQVGLATRTGASGSFTRASTSPVLPAATGWEGSAIEAGPGRLIKVSSTYYLHYSVVAGPTGTVRQSGVATSTDLTTWTKDAANPILGGGRFCNSIWTEGGVYYSLCPVYLGDGTSHDQIELWSSTSPQFYAADRKLVDIVLPLGSSGPSWSSSSFDTPALITDDITRSSWTCTNNVRQVIYSGEDSSGNWLQGVGTLNQVAA